MAWDDVPSASFRSDGYMNMLTRYGTMQDSSTAWQFRGDGMIPDMQLTEQYENNGLFSKIIDLPAEEAIKHGFDLGLTDKGENAYFTDMLDLLDWDEKATTAIKWARLYGGALGVLLINDGRGIEEPLNWQRARSIEEIRIYERACVWPDYSILHDFNNMPKIKQKSRAPTHNMPELYYVNSIYGQFWVHKSRCLIFRNGILPEHTMSPNYRFWGVPEYLRIQRELRESSTSHSTSIKMLERAVQPIYKMKDLAKLVSRDYGEEDILKRLQIIDMARSILNSIAIDADNEEYTFEEFSLSGVREIVEAADSALSAVTHIPQTLLFGRSPAGMNSTGKSELEIWYNSIERIQRLNLRRNTRTVLDAIICTGLASGELKEKPDYTLTFNPLWSESESEQAKTTLTKAQARQTNAQAARTYVEMDVLAPFEVRKGLAQEGDFCVEELLENIEASEEMSDIWQGSDLPIYTQDSRSIAKGVGVIVVNASGWVLAGTRKDNGQICGPGGHIEPGETAKMAAIRETVEEFGITPISLRLLGQLDTQNNPFIFLCTEYDGEPKCNDGEMTKPQWIDPNGDEGFSKNGFFPAFRDSLKLFINASELN